MCTVAFSWRLFRVPSPPTSQTGGEAQWHYDTFTFLRCRLLSKRRCTRLTWGAGAWPSLASTTFSTGGFLRECHIKMRN
jgi:hypothetical protein